MIEYEEQRPYGSLTYSVTNAGITWKIQHEGPKTGGLCQNVNVIESFVIRNKDSEIQKTLLFNRTGNRFTFVIFPT